MSTKHTPGPWKDIGDSDNSGRHWVSDSRNRTVAMLCPMKEKPANAQLISAAPDLLAACNIALKEMVGWPSMFDAAKIVAAAIKKAEGKELPDESGSQAQSMMERK